MYFGRKDKPFYIIIFLSVFIDSSRIEKGRSLDPRRKYLRVLGPILISL